MDSVSSLFVSNRCTHCNAGPHNAYKHDENCLLNLPKHTTETIRWWKIGQNEKKVGAKPSIYMPHDSIEDKSYMMGFRCKKIAA